MAKISNTKTFTFIDEKGTTHTVVCYTTHTNIRTTEHAECDGYHGKDYWYNRPWYRFTYENALLDLAGKMANGNEKDNEKIIDVSRFGYVEGDYAQVWTITIECRGKIEHEYFYLYYYDKEEDKQ